MKPIKIIFIGTGEIGVSLMEALVRHPQIDLTLVVTGIDKPMGRKMQLTPNEIKKAALNLGLDTFQPENINETSALEKLKGLNPDFLLVMAYGQMLKQPVLELPQIDCLNVHTSLLPTYRGASPIKSAILNGEEVTGISLMRVIKKMDAGPVYFQFKTDISNTDTGQTLSNKMAKLAAEEVPGAIVRIVDESLEPVEQNEAEATHVSKLEKADGVIDWSDSAEKIDCKIRAFNPWPSAFTFFEGKRLKIHQAKAHATPLPHKPGTVCEVEGRVGVSCGEGFLELIEVQVEGRKAQSIEVFLNGNQGFVGGEVGVKGWKLK